MARHARRLITWIGGGLLALVLLAVMAVMALVWLVDPNVYRSRIASTAAGALGREVQLGGDLRWRIGWEIAVESAGGSIGNAPGFGATPFAQWRSLRFGLDTRALLGKRIVIDRLELDGLQLNLQRNAAREGNWDFASQDGAGTDEPVAFQVASIRLRDSQLTYSDGAGDTWRLDELSLDVTLPPDLKVPQRELRGVELHGRLAGGPLANAGVPVAFEAASLKHDATAQALELPAFRAQWDEAQLSGNVSASLGEPVSAQGRLALRVPSVRALLAGLDITPPPMADPTTLGKLQVDGDFDLKGPSLAATGLKVVLDDTTLDGTVSAASLSPLELRFDLAGDSIELDRYLEPADYKGKPLELPLAQLKALNVQGVLRLKSATVAGAKAQELRIDVE